MVGVERWTVPSPQGTGLILRVLQAVFLLFYSCPLSRPTPFTFTKPVCVWGGGRDAFDKKTDKWGPAAAKARRGAESFTDSASQSPPRPQTQLLGPPLNSAS